MQQEGIRERMRKIAYEILKDANGKAMRFGDLVGKVVEKSGYDRFQAIHACWDLDDHYDDVIKPERGMIQLPLESVETESKGVIKGRDHEKVLYDPFKNWLIFDMEVCTKAITVGGKKFKDKWGTPDVIGVRYSKRSEIIQIPLEVITAEIKMNPNEITTGFGQACAYRLFSHKVYLVIPSESNGTSKEDLERVDTLCQLFGIGLVLFTKETEGEKGYSFETRVRPQKYEPDLFYVNYYLEHFKGDLF